MKGGCAMKEETEKKNEDQVIKIVVGLFTIGVLGAFVGGYFIGYNNAIANQIIEDVRQNGLG